MSSFSRRSFMTACAAAISLLPGASGAALRFRMENNLCAYLRAQRPFRNLGAACIAASPQQGAAQRYRCLASRLDRDTPHWRLLDEPELGAALHRLHLHDLDAAAMVRVRGCYLSVTEALVYGLAAAL